MALVDYQDDWGQPAAEGWEYPNQMTPTEPIQTTRNSIRAVAAAYEKVFGKPMPPEEYDQWATVPDFEAKMAAVAPAKAAAITTGDKIPPPASVSTTATAAAAAGPRYQKGGVDADKWNDPTHQTAKYQVLRILDQVDPMTLGREGLLKLPDAVKKQITDLGFTIVDEDKISGNGLPPIDVLHGKRDEYGWRDTTATKPPKISPPVSPPGVPPDGGLKTVDSHPKGFLPLGPGTAAPGGNKLTSLLTPYDRKFVAPTEGIPPPVPQYAKFMAPDPSQIYKDPSFKFRMGEGQRALENSAAAKGLTRSANTWKGLMDYGQNFASNEYQNIFARDLAGYETNRATDQGVFDRQTNRAKDIYGRSFDEYGRDWQMWDKNRSDVFNFLRWQAEFGKDAAAK